MDIVQIRPKGDDFFLGLEKYGKRKFDDTTYEIFGIPMLNGKFQHGLTDKEKEQVENYFNHRFDPTDPDAVTFWGNKLIRVDNNLDVTATNEAEALLKKGVMVRMGLLATTIEEAEKPNTRAQYVIRDKSAEEEAKVEKFATLMEAMVRLAEIKKNDRLLRAIAAILLRPAVAFNKNVNAFLKLGELLQGDADIVGSEGSAVDAFVKLLDGDRDFLLLRADVKKAIYTGVIRRDPSTKMYVNKMTGAEYGRDEDTVVDYLNQPKNIGELGDGTAKQAKEAPTTVRAQLLNL